MKLTIQYKLFLALLTAAVAVISYMAVVIQWSFDKGFLEYIDTTEQEEIGLLATELETHYAEYKSWDQLKAEPEVILRLRANTLPDGKRKELIVKKLSNNDYPGWFTELNNETQNRRPLHAILRTVVLDKNKDIVYGRQFGDQLPSLRPIYYQNQEVGYIGHYPPKILSNSHQLLFVKKQKLIILLVGVAAIFITIGLSLPLAFHLTKPVRRLSEATRKLITGDYSTRVAISSQDELGQLSRDINSLAQTLAQNETQRKLWVSDIAHELRTPLTALQGEVEAVQDGIRKPDEQTFTNLHHGVMRLKRLVEDLYDLSRSELGVLSFYREKIDLGQLLKDEITTRTGELKQAELTIKLEGTDQPLYIFGDRQRLHQLIGNLLNNSINYTDRGGTIALSLQSDQATVQLDIHDTAPGVPDDSLPLLFKRLYRVEESRNRALGGSGLGLAICQQIVKAHDGTITAQHSPAGGVWIQVTLPLLGEK